MIITLANTHSVGKTTLANSFCHLLYAKKYQVTCCDATICKSLLNRRKIDEKDMGGNSTSLYPLKDFDINTIKTLFELEDIAKSKNLFVFDISGGNQYSYYDIFKFTHLLVVPIIFTEECYLQTISFFAFLQRTSIFNGKVLFVPNSVHEKGDYDYKDVFINSIANIGKISSPLINSNLLENIYTNRFPDNVTVLFKKIFPEFEKELTP